MKELKEDLYDQKKKERKNCCDIKEKETQQKNCLPKQKNKENDEYKTKKKTC